MVRKKRDVTFATHFAVRPTLAEVQFGRDSPAGDILYLHTIRQPYSYLCYCSFAPNSAGELPHRRRPATMRWRKAKNLFCSSSDLLLFFHYRHNHNMQNVHSSDENKMTATANSSLNLILYFFASSFFCHKRKLTATLSSYFHDLFVALKEPPIMYCCIHSTRLRSSFYLHSSARPYQELIIIPFRFVLAFLVNLSFFLSLSFCVLRKIFPRDLRLNYFVSASELGNDLE